ncbi:hypothetical protein BSK63_25895 [Paenibacillus odorifer]|nr:hypothetical protein BSK63_25895 [Paenibacillus odorifer]OME32313.1 hypothetical protein BSK46_24145 [Paenibacillus odorifer]
MARLDLGAYARLARSSRLESVRHVLLACAILSFRLGTPFAAGLRTQMPLLLEKLPFGDFFGLERRYGLIINPDSAYFVQIAPLVSEKAPK